MEKSVRYYGFDILILKAWFDRYVLVSLGLLSAETMGKVFISYSHDSQQHTQLVLQLANALRSHGIDAELDQYHARPPQGWAQWCEEQLRPENSEFVLVICTDTYRKRVENQTPADEGHGVNWEGKIIYSYLYTQKENARFIPIVFGGKEEDIPRPLRDTTRYNLKVFELGDSQYQALYRELTRQPATTKPLLGRIIPMPTVQGATHAAGSGKSGDFEFEDGTNIPPGTAYWEEELGWKVMPWYVPSKSMAPNDWKENWRRLRSRLEKLIDSCQPLQCVLIQTRLPAYGAERSINPSDYPRLLFAGEGLERTACKLHPLCSQSMAGKFLIHGANGRPILTTDGQPHAFRFGLSRYFIVRSGHKYQGDPRPVPHPQFSELAQDAAALLYQLPSNIAMQIWKNWPSGFSRARDSKEFLWLDALFELSWQNQPGSTLFTKRFARKENSAIGLIGDGLFPRLPSGLGLQFTSEGGNPTTWHAEIADVIRVSVAAIDQILRGP